MKKRKPTKYMFLKILVIITVADKVSKILFLWFLGCGSLKLKSCKRQKSSLRSLDVMIILQTDLLRLCNIVFRNFGRKQFLLVVYNM